MDGIIAHHPPVRTWNTFRLPTMLLLLVRHVTMTTLSARPFDRRRQVYCCSFARCRQTTRRASPGEMATRGWEAAAIGFLAGLRAFVLAWHPGICLGDLEIELSAFSGRFRSYCTASGRSQKANWGCSRARKYHLRWRHDDKIWQSSWTVKQKLVWCNTINKIWSNIQNSTKQVGCRCTE